MSESRTGFYAVVLACIGLCTIATLQGARAGQDKTGVLKVASVDLGRMNTEYASFNKNIKALMDKNNANVTAFQALQQNPLLSEAEHQQLFDLMLAEGTQQGGLNAQQKDQKQKLLDKSRTMSQEFFSLQEKKVADLQPQDKEKLNTYFRSQTEATARLQKMQGQTGELLRGEAEKNQTTAIKTMRDTIGKIAKEKGISVVFSNEVVWFADNDITDAVLKELNK
jgi:Skp family chaperone for outer membrane proteins